MAALAIGEKAVDFNLPATDGNNYSLESFSGKKALAVIFSCVHCPYVLAWEDRIISLQNEYAARGAAFVQICANDAAQYPQDSFENMKTHAASNGFPFPFLHDESQQTARAYGAERTPEVFLFDSEGALAFHGAVDDNYEDPGNVRQRWLRDALEAVTAGKTPPKQTVPARGCSIKWK